jgi:pyrroloquinoline quinone biosynthesis protein B
MRVKVLGSAAGGGAPQWNCGCTNCSGLRRGTLKGRARTQTQLALSTSEGAWLLVNASPDLRQQLISDPEFAPQSRRGSPIHAVVLSSADVDSVLGLLHLREFQPFKIYCTASVQRILTEENSLFRTLDRAHPPIEWRLLSLDRETTILESNSQPPILCKAVSMKGKFPDYVSDGLRRTLPHSEAVIALDFAENGKRLLFAPAIPDITEALQTQIAQSEVALLDGTFFTDDELVKVRGAGVTASSMGHVPLSGPDRLIDKLKSARNTRRILIHLNNTNPALDEESDAARMIREAGYEIAFDGMEFTL